MSRRLMFRMIAPIASISILLLVLGAGGAWYMHRLQSNLSDVLAVNVASVRAAEELEIGMLEIRGLVKDCLYTGDMNHLAGIQKLRHDTDHWLREAEHLATSPHEQQLVTRIKQGYQHFFLQLDDFHGNPPVGPAAGQARAALEQILTQEILKPAHEYLDYNEDIIVENSGHNRAISRHIMITLVLLGTCGAAAGLLAGYGIARGIARSIGQLRGPIEDAAGRLNEVTGPMLISSGQELTDLEANLQTVAQQAGTVIERLHESQRDVLRAEQLAATGQLAAGLAHELRNPLMSMKVLVQPAAERGSEISLSQRDLEVVNEEITRLEELIQTFLDYARPPQPEKRPVDLQSVLEQTLLLVSGRADQQGVRLERALPARPVVIEADVGQLRQVILNLLLNALDATPEGGQVIVQVEHESGGPPPAPNRAASPAEWLTIRIADTGRGLPADLGSRIFEPFISTKETGLGLGLSICKRIVEAHGGEVAAVARPGGGAVFTVRLPARAAGPRRPRNGALAAAASPEAASTRDGGYHADPADRR